MDSSASAARSYVVDTTGNSRCRLRPVPVGAVRLEDGFWAEWQRRNREISLPYMHRQLEETGSIDNFRALSGRRSAESRGPVYRDSDVYKWMEAVSWSLAAERDPALEEMLEGVIDEVAAAQDPDGYLNTYFVGEHRAERWSNLTDWHELYCAGHLIQAAVAHYRATGRRTLLDVAVRFADHIDGVFGPGKRPGTSGHPEIEMALVELGRATGQRRYVDLALFFLDERGGRPPRAGGRAYHIDHKPFRELDEITGHAVRALYLAAGATDLYVETGEGDLLKTIDRLWADATLRKAYVTGGLGAHWQGESFGAAWELPNRRAYAETCAAIAGAMWAWRLLLLKGKAGYADFIERILYNGFLSGISLDGMHYFYQNPLASDGTHRRQPWFGCACCPPNIARTLASLGGYFYGVSDDGIWVHQYGSGRVETELPSGTRVRLVQKTRYPWETAVEIGVAAGGSYAVHLRIPEWSRAATLRLNGETFRENVRGGRYVPIRRVWAPGETIRLEFDSEPSFLECHPRVDSNAGRVALQRGPLVYCFEGADQPDVPIFDAEIATTGTRVEERPDLLGGIAVVRVPARIRDLGPWEGILYRRIGGRRLRYAGERELTAIPYYAWANREAGPMQVWMPRWKK